MTSEKRRELARRMLEAIDEDLCETFCTGCEAREVSPATEIDPQDETCPADFNPCDPGCVRKAKYTEVLRKTLAAVDELEAG